MINKKEIKNNDNKNYIWFYLWIIITWWLIYNYHENIWYIILWIIWYIMWLFWGLISFLFSINWLLIIIAITLILIFLKIK